MEKLLIKKPIKLIVADIDGCMSNGSFSHFEPELLIYMRDVNGRYEAGEPGIPAITYNTGRPQEYVEALSQMTRAPYPAICESGAMMFTFKTHEIKMNPAIGKDDFVLIRNVQDAVNAVIEAKGLPFMWEPGRSLQQVLIILPPYKSEDYVDMVEAAARPVCGDRLQIKSSWLCVHFVFPRFDKGVGLQWLCNETGLDLEECAGLGDSEFDVPFLKLCGLSAAPASGDEAARGAVDYVCEKPQPWATKEFIDLVIEQNRLLGGAQK